MTRRLLVTGFGRSGTTLLQQLLHGQPEFCVAPQPFPGLFIRAKQRHLGARGVETPNPLDPWFPRLGGTLADLDAFLDSDHWDEADLDELFAEVATDTNSQVDGLPDRRGEVRPGTFFAVYDQLLALSSELVGASGRPWVGSKEIVCEEFAALVVARGGGAVIVIRDPRDMLASSLHGDARTFVGARRPTLFLLRQWRKSVAFALHLHRRPGFAAVRYEDLVADPAASIASIRRLLLGPDAEPDRETMPSVATSGTANSSFGTLTGVSTAPVGRWSEHLDPTTAGFVETVCGPEMDCLGYVRSTVSYADRMQTIDGFVEPHVVDHARFSSDYSTNPTALEAERRRLELVTRPDPADDLERWFLFPETHGQLQAKLDPTTLEDNR